MKIIAEREKEKKDWRSFAGCEDFHAMITEYESVSDICCSDRLSINFLHLINERSTFSIALQWFPVSVWDQIRGTRKKVMLSSADLKWLNSTVALI